MFISPVPGLDSQRHSLQGANFLLNIGWFSTGRDEAARQLLQIVDQNIRNGEIEGKLLFVFSNREPGESLESDRFFQLAQSYDLPLIYHSSNPYNFANTTTASTRKDESYKRRIQYDRDVMGKLENFSPDLCVLAGYMLIVGEEMCKKYTMINLHPAMPGGPKGSWQDVIWQLIAEKAPESGVMIHIVTPDLDRGPVISYCKYSIIGETFNTYWSKLDKIAIKELKETEGESNQLFNLIRRSGLKRELPLMVATLKALSHGVIKIENGKVIDNLGNQISGYDLTDQIDKIIGAR